MIGLFKAGFEALVAARMKNQGWLMQLKLLQQHVEGCATLMLQFQPQQTEWCSLATVFGLHLAWLHLARRALQPRVGMSQGMMNWH